MRNKIDNILRYLIKNYPYADELSKTRTTKLIYLIDWENSLKNGSQITDIKWYFDHYGPYVSDVFDTADEDPEIRIVETISNFGTRKYLVESKIPIEQLLFDLSEDEQKVVNKVISETQNLNWNDFIDFVYSTYPIKNSSKYGALDLVELAQKYKDNL